MIAQFLRDPEDKVAAGRPRYLSHSRVNRYLLCPEQYRLYYVENLRPTVPSASLVFGQLVHQALAGLFLKQVDPVKSFQESWAVVKGANLYYNQRESWERLSMSGEALLERFAEEEVDKIQNIRTVEKPFEFGLSGLDLPFVGVIDLECDLEAKSTVVDFKTAGSGYDSHEVILSDQLSAYYLAQPGIAQVALCVLVKTKAPKIEWHIARRSGGQLSEYLTKIGYVAREISAGRFYKRPGTWCSWCDFLPVCVGDHKAAESSLIKVR
jgi:CRISPR/Cas system-associated exonuclease Cas4 (RecB family)